MQWSARLAHNQQVGGSNPPPATINETPNIMSDPWKHRNESMCCRTCMWFLEKVSTVEDDRGIMFGRCRRRAPTMNGYPAVFGNDWCGDHKLDENRI